MSLVGDVTDQHIGHAFILLSDPSGLQLRRQPFETFIGTREVGRIAGGTTLAG